MPQNGTTGVFLQIERYKITRIDLPAPGVRIFRLEPLAGKVPDYLPGQFAFLHILADDGSSVVRRPYSIASCPSSPYLEFAIDMVGGQMTGRLEKAAVGGIIGVECPAGHMPYRGEGRAAFIAGGTGVAPFISTLRHIAEKKIEGEFVLFYSTRKEGQILYRDELRSLASRNPGIRIVITLTREEPAGWAGECGRINAQMLKKHIEHPEGFDWWVCGPPPMVKAVRECLSSLSVDLRRLRMEGW